MRGEFTHGPNRVNSPFMVVLRLVLSVKQISIRARLLELAGCGRPADVGILSAKGLYAEPLGNWVFFNLLGR